MFKIRNKHVLLELLEDGSAFEKIVLAQNLDQDHLTKKIVEEARKRQIPVETKPRVKISKRRGGENREVLIGFLKPNKFLTFEELLDKLYAKNEFPFFLVMNRVKYENNIGVIARTAFAAGVNGIFFQGEGARFLNEETLHFSLGALARVPLVKMNIFEIIKKFKANGIPTFALCMQGKDYSQENLCGPAAFVLGSEREGLSNEISQKCDKQLSIPMQEGIDSLNVGVSSGIILYEKVRQEKLCQSSNLN